VSTAVAAAACTARCCTTRVAACGCGSVPRCTASRRWTAAVAAVVVGPSPSLPAARTACQMPLRSTSWPLVPSCPRPASAPCMHCGSTAVASTTRCRWCRCLDHRVVLSHGCTPTQHRHLFASQTDAGGSAMPSSTVSCVGPAVMVMVVVLLLPVVVVVVVLLLHVLVARPRTRAACGVRVALTACTPTVSRRCGARSIRGRLTIASRACWRTTAVPRAASSSTCVTAPAASCPHASPPVTPYLRSTPTRGGCPSTLVCS
jgi:hypothetical protein